MKAAQISEYGKDVVKINPDAEMPELSSGNVIVKVHAAGVNPIDWKITEGYLGQALSDNFPLTVGDDFAGTVEEVGEDVTEYTKGDNVYGSGGVRMGGSGAIAEYLVTGVNLISKKPEDASNHEAAALPLTGVSAVDVIYNKIKLEKGQKILIHGGSGGIGSMAIQIAKHLGAYVATTARKDKVQYLKDLGADEIIDYKDEVFEEILKDYDAVFDTVGGDTYKRSFKVLKKGGVIVSMLGQPDTELMNKYQVNALGQFTQTNSDSLKKLAELFDDGAIKVYIDRVFPLDEAAEALKYQRDNSVKGKVVIEIN
ncbi:NADP-dependent oxidoreductase [Methanolobus sediminis]|uniref:NADP-dependent oxidoreductase n=1 Tax=Methanolobus sediminis TaxID=3072978 RepID=A0AA51UJ64_9EURY|nr:NADP-dependent oxidoreductase [Methanolobus sediminis]WMW24531.1 NADP-dependent oxidoreductase [Methanolobus sediminis]